jgi:hypothetical protein
MFFIKTKKQELKAPVFFDKDFFMEIVPKFKTSLISRSFPLNQKLNPFR